MRRGDRRGKRTPVCPVRPQHLVEKVGVSGVEEVRQTLLDAFHHLGPHRVDQEVVAGNDVGFVAGGEKERPVRSSICRV